MYREIAFDVPEADAPASPEREEARREAILEELLTLSRKAFEAENKIGLDQAEALIANARAGFDAQSDERRANFELFGAPSAPASSRLAMGSRLTSTASSTSKTLMSAARRASK